MTWEQFVEIVQSKMQEEGIESDAEIFYIDTGNFPTEKRLEVGQSKEGWLVINA